MANPQDVYRSVLEQSSPATLPDHWKTVRPHPGWVQLNTSGLLDRLTGRFDAEELLAANVVRRDGEQLVLHPRLERGADLTFVVQTSPTDPYAILPHGKSLSAMPGWRVLLGDCRIRQQIAGKQPLFLTDSPQSTAILHSCGALAMVHPRIENIDAMFCHGLIDALKCNPAANIVAVGWDVAGLQPFQSQRSAPLFEHMQRIKRLTNAPLEFSRWSAPASTIEDLAFLLRFAPDRAAKFVLQAANSQTRSLAVVRPAQRRLPTLAKNTEEYLAACLNRLPPGKRNQLRGALAESIRVERVEPACDAAAQMEPAERLQHDLAAQVAGLALLDVTEAVGERLLANEPGPGEPPPRSAASVTMAAERAVKLLQGLRPTQKTNLETIRRAFR